MTDSRQYGPDTAMGDQQRTFLHLLLKVFFVQKIHRRIVLWDIVGVAFLRKYRICYFLLFDQPVYLSQQSVTLEFLGSQHHKYQLSIHQKIPPA